MSDDLSNNLRDASAALDEASDVWDNDGSDEAEQLMYRAQRLLGQAFALLRMYRKQATE